MNFRTNEAFCTKNSDFAEEEEVILISAFDGQFVWKNSTLQLFEVGNFLGGGAAGTVYECEHINSHKRYALKILNPLGYKIISPTLLRKCSVITKGTEIYADQTTRSQKMKLEHVWWLLNPSSRQYHACFFSEKQNCLKELTLLQCIDIWGTNSNALSDDEIEMELIKLDTAANFNTIPRIPPKFLEFIKKRNRIFREIKNMRKISNHRNVIKLETVLELIQESKCTIFLVLELANGGELFDRIKIDQGTREETASIFFRQLLEGVKHCHDQGVCHRDLKPEVSPCSFHNYYHTNEQFFLLLLYKNLLLQDDGSGGTVLKVNSTYAIILIKCIGLLTICIIIVLDIIFRSQTLVFLHYFWMNPTLNRNIHANFPPAIRHSIINRIQFQLKVKLKNRA